MTYKEAYMKLGSKEEILEMVKRDIALASFINPDRIKIISKAAEEVLNEKFSEKKGVNNFDGGLQK